MVADFLKVVANPNRLRILFFLAKGEHAVSQIEHELGIRQPTLSQQLGALREAEVVSTRRDHKVVYYRLTDPRMLALLSAMEDILVSSRPIRRVPPRTVEVRARTLGQAAVFGRVGDEA
ncbi:winged helix-turn-helix transcriptional regulator [Methylobacterium sp. WL8]|nr:winged helix-turn-helix transcriptional regulator [Methylobacterium sp. WL122]TXN84346.1 winged helix-turn-helix transcriptional regulator [Methylobacterium sp. WL8]